MLAMMPKREESLISAAVTEQTYRSDLEDLPVEDLIRAFGDWRSGRHKRPDGSPFAPSIGEVRALVEKRIGDRLMAAKRDRLEREALEESRAYRERVSTQNPEHRNRVQQLVDGFKAGLPRDPVGPTQYREPTRDEALEGLETLADRMSGPVEVSERLMARLGVFPRERMR